MKGDGDIGESSGGEDEEKWKIKVFNSFLKSN